MIRLIVIASSSSMTQMIITSFFMDVPFVVQFSIFPFFLHRLLTISQTIYRIQWNEENRNQIILFFLVNLPKFIVVVRLVCLFCDAVVTLCAHRNPLWCQSNGTYLILFGLHLAKEINNHLYIALQHGPKWKTAKASNFSFCPSWLHLFSYIASRIPEIENLRFVHKQIISLPANDSLFRISRELFVDVFDFIGKNSLHRFCTTEESQTRSIADIS